MLSVIYETLDEAGEKREKSGETKHDDQCNALVCIAITEWRAGSVTWPAK